MRKQINLLSLIFMFLGTVIFAKEPMVIVYSHTYLPLSWINEKGNAEGLEVDLMNEALVKRMGITVIHKALPWKRAQNMVVSGEADAFVTIPTAERRKFTVISNIPAVSVKAGIFSRKNHHKMELLKKVESIDDLKPFHFVTWLGNGWAIENLKGKGHIGSWVQKQNQVVRLLINEGRADYYPENELIGHSLLSRLDTKKEIIQVPDVTITVYDYNLCIGKKSSYVNIMPEFEKVIKQMNDEGVSKQIYERCKTRDYSEVVIKG